MNSRPRRSKQAWVAFLISSALIIGTLAPVVRYGTVILLYPVFVLFGCDGARSGADCLRILITPLVPIALTVIALIGCRLAVRRGWYLGSVLGAAVACGASWMVILRGG